VSESRGGTGAASPRSSSPGAAAGLIVRNQVRLTLAGARAIVAGAEAKAQAMGWKMNIAVVDDGGHLLAFERMDGARPASGYTAITKATTAATFRQPSGPLPAGTTSPDPLLNISLQLAALAGGGKLTTLYGGVPVVVDGQIIGGVGVGGGSGEQDAQVARAGIQALLEQLATTRADSGEKSAPGDASPARQPAGVTRPQRESSF
jgi:glc operon protein GlcG